MSDKIMLKLVTPVPIKELITITKSLSKLAKDRGETALLRQEDIYLVIYVREEFNNV